MAEREVARFAVSGRRGVVLRLGLLDGPGTGNETPNEWFGATLHVEDAARALLAALAPPSGVYKSFETASASRTPRFKEATGWRPEH